MKKPCRPDATQASRTSPSGLTRRGIITGMGVVALGARSMPVRAAPAPAAAPRTVEAGPEAVATVHMDAKPALVEFQPGIATDIWTFGGRAPGPELRLKPGEEFKARLVNNTARPLSVHWHGMRIANDQDGVAGLTHDPVAPGATLDLRFTPPDSGTFIYRPMVLGGTGEATDRGLAGVAVVEEASPPPVDSDLIVAVDDWLLKADGSHAPFGEPAERAGVGRLGTMITVNGVRAPARITARPGGRIRLRLANLCNARLMRIRFDRLKAYVIAVDSQPTDTFEPLRATLPFAPGARYDVLIELPSEVGAAGDVIALIGNGIPLVSIVTEGEAATRTRPVYPAIAPLAENKLLPASIPLQRAQRVDMTIEGGAQPAAGGLEYKGDPQHIWTVNGVSGPTLGERFGKPLVSVKRGAAIVVTAKNRTSFAQVLHVHGHSVRLLHPFDDGWDPYWMDTIIISEGQTVRFAFVADNKGRWLIGSGVLERLDTGLSAWFEVT